jgi:hypothetical protein
MKNSFRSNFVLHLSHHLIVNLLLLPFFKLSFKVQLLQKKNSGIRLIDFFPELLDPCAEKLAFFLEFAPKGSFYLREGLALKKVTNYSFIDIERHLKILDHRQVLPPLSIEKLLLVFLQGLYELLGVRLLICEYL